MDIWRCLCGVDDGTLHKHQNWDSLWICHRLHSQPDKCGWIEAFFHVCSDGFIFSLLALSNTVNICDAEPLECRSNASLEKHQHVQAQRQQTRVFLSGGADTEIMGSYTRAKTNKGQRGHKGKTTALHICTDTSICMLKEEAFTINATLMIKLAKHAAGCVSTKMPKTYICALGHELTHSHTADKKKSAQKHAAEHIHGWPWYAYV